jgi:hypothetical protein
MTRIKVLFVVFVVLATAHGAFAADSVTLGLSLPILEESYSSDVASGISGDIDASVRGIGLTIDYANFIGRAGFLGILLRMDIYAPTVWERKTSTETYTIKFADESVDQLLGGNLFFGPAIRLPLGPIGVIASAGVHGGVFFAGWEDEFEIYLYTESEFRLGLGADVAAYIELGNLLVKAGAQASYGFLGSAQARLENVSTGVEYSNESGSHDPYSGLWLTFYVAVGTPF